MKLAIFGDSFGDDTGIWPVPHSDVGPSWIDYLRNQNIDIDNYSRGGTSLFYSYQKFISNYQKYDKIIFLITNPGRISVPMDGTIKDFNIGSIERHLKLCVNVERQIILNAIRDYFIYVKNDEFDEVVHRLLVEDISNKHNDMLMIPCFDRSGIDNQTPLLDISKFEADFWNIEEIIPQADLLRQDSRKAHMCEENNLMLGQEIYNWIKTGSFSLKHENFKTPTKEFSHYFRTDFLHLIKNKDE
jgi:hypothetical protein